MPFSPFNYAQSVQAGTQNALGTMQARQLGQKIQDVNKIRQIQQQAGQAGGNLPQMLSQAGFQPEAMGLQEQMMADRINGMKYIVSRAPLVTDQSSYDAFKKGAEDIGAANPGELPDAYNQDLMNHLIGSASNDLKNTPKSVQEWNLFNSLSPQDQQKYLTMKRANTYLNLGGGYAQPNPLQPGGTLGTQYPKTAPPGKMAEPITDKSAPWHGMKLQSQVDAAKAKFGAQADKAVAQAQKIVPQAQNMQQKLQRFVQLNQVVSTGPGYDIPILGAVARGAKRITDPKFQEMQSISDYLTPIMRQGLPGSASDRDVAMFRGATVGVGKNPEANRNIAQGLMVVSQNSIDHANFLSDWASQKGYIRGANKEWNTYLQSNPIFSPDATKKDYTLNTHRMSYQDWVNNGRPMTPQSQNKPFSLHKATQAAIDHLKENPNLKQQFDDWYGPGSASQVLGQ